MSLLKFASGRFDKVHALKKWLRNPGQGRDPFDLYELKKKLPKDTAAPTSTHTELMGGQYVVPAEFNDEFLWHLAISLHQGHLSSLVERRTEFFRYHLDMDFAEAEVVTLERLRPYMLTVQEVVRRFFPFAGKDFLECVICSASGTKIVIATDGTTKQLKSGFHILFPHIWVHTDQALAMRADLIVHLTKKFGERKQPFKNNWADVVDESVYVGSGLRVVGAVKVSMCKTAACKEKWGRSKKKPPPPPQIEGLPQKNNPAKKLVKDTTSSTDTNNSKVHKMPSGADIYKALTTSSNAALLTRDSVDHSVAATASNNTIASVDSVVECEKCDNRGRVFEGRPYFLTALWDFKCDDLVRTVRVPKMLSDDTPKYVAPVASLYPDEQHIADIQTVNPAAPPIGKNIFFAMSMPHWTPRDDLFDDDELGDELGLEPMDIDNDDTFVTMPIRDLLIFGDVLTTSEGGAAATWETVRKLHNVFRLTTLRSPPALELALKAHYSADVPSMSDEVTKHCPHFVRPADAPGYSNRHDAIRRHHLGYTYTLLCSQKLYS
jgi:hypothetical protein